MSRVAPEVDCRGSATVRWPARSSCPPGCATEPVCVARACFAFTRGKAMAVCTCGRPRSGGGEKVVYNLGPPSLCSLCQLGRQTAVNRCANAAAAAAAGFVIAVAAPAASASALACALRPVCLPVCLPVRLTATLTVCECCCPQSEPITKPRQF